MFAGVAEDRKYIIVAGGGRGGGGRDKMFVGVAKAVSYGVVACVIELC